MNSRELVHYDGTTWTVIETGTEDRIEAMWADSGVLYFITNSEFGRHDASGTALIIHKSDNTFPTALWGRSANEVSVTLQNGVGDYRCGSQFILWYDGSELHQF